MYSKIDQKESYQKTFKNHMGYQQLKLMNWNKYSKCKKGWDRYCVEAFELKLKPFWHLYFAMEVWQISFSHLTKQMQFARSKIFLFNRSFVSYNTVSLS